MFYNVFRRFWSEAAFQCARKTFLYPFTSRKWYRISVDGKLKLCFQIYLDKYGRGLFEILKGRLRQAILFACLHGGRKMLTQGSSWLHVNSCDRRVNVLNRINFPFFNSFKDEFNTTKTNHDISDPNVSEVIRNRAYIVSIDDTEVMFNRKWLTASGDDPITVMSVYECAEENTETNKDSTSYGQ